MTFVDIFRKLVANNIEPQYEINDPDMRRRNEERMAAIKEEMGEKWILHPSHKKSRLEEPRPV